MEGQEWVGLGPLVPSLHMNYLKIFFIQMPASILGTGQEPDFRTGERLSAKSQVQGPVFDPRRKNQCGQGEIRHFGA